MSAKFVYNMSDDNPDLQKQIGCMNGIFQLFDHHHFLGGRRRYIGQRHKRLPSGQNGNHGMEPEHTSQNTTEKDDKITRREKHRTSNESSRTSFSSSSCSSSLSSLESAKATQREPFSFSQTVVTQESRQRDSPMYRSNASPLSTCQSPDLRHAVKSSIFRETRGISVKTATKGEAGGRTLKYIDSPRPLQRPKSVEPKSIHVYQNCQETSFKSSERAESSFSSSIKDVRRLSLDGRESRDAFKSTMKLKELPRLSLDSRAGLTRRYKNEVGISHPLQDTGSVNFNDFVSRQEAGTSRQSSSVVTKLMGLEALSDHLSNDGNKAGQFEGYHDLDSDPTQSPKTSNQKASSPRCPRKEPSSHRTKDTGSVKKNTSKTMSSTESAPWSHSLGKTKSSTSAFLSEATTGKDQSSSISVFGEMEKRLAQLEFKKSGKDLRALKQILEAMHKTRETFENRSDASEFASHTSGNKSLDLSSDLASPRTPRSDTTRKKYSSSESSKSPIVIMKPAKLTGKVRYLASSINQNDDLGLDQLETADSEGGRNKSNDKQTARDLTRKTNDLRMSTRNPTHTLDKSPRATPTPPKLTSTLNDLQSITTRERTDYTKNLKTTNSRHQQRKPVLEKHSLSMDLNRVTRQTCRQFKQPGSQQRQPKSKPSNLQMMDQKPSNTNEVRSSSYWVDAVSQQSESNVGKASLFDAEVTSTDRSKNILSPPIQPTLASQKVTKSIKDIPMTDPIVAPLEQPSPVSVLDATFYDDELPSPIKKISTSFKDDEIFSDELDWNFIAANHSSSSINSSSVIDSEKVETINHFNQQLEQVLSANESITNELEPFNNSPCSEQVYISEIILESGLLKDFISNYTAATLNSTAHPIKPDLLLAMEQARESKGRSDQGSDETISQQKLAKTQRKLLFDVLNEVLCQKLLLESSSKMWHPPITLAHKVPQGLKLWEEFCAEVDRLKSTYSTCSLDTEDDSMTGILREDLMQQTPYWRSDSEIPWLVLNVERLIFKDLINEVVIGEAMSLQRQSVRHYRQLFSK